MSAMRTSGGGVALEGRGAMGRSRIVSSAPRRVDELSGGG